MSKTAHADAISSTATGSTVTSAAPIAATGVRTARTPA